MAAVANNPAFAKKAGIPQSVGSDFVKADKGHKFSKGGDTMATKGVNPFAKFEKSGKDAEAKGKGKEGSKKEEAFDKSQMGMKKGGGVKKMASGGLAAGHKSADGIASKGKTKGTNIVMKNGGKTC